MENLTPDEIAALEAATAAANAKTAADAEAARVAAEAEKSKEKPTPDELQKQLDKERNERQKANAEAAKHRAELKKYQDAEAERELAGKSELEKAQIALKATQDELAQSRKVAQDAMIQALATTKGFADPSDALALLDRSQIDATGSNLGTLVDALAKAKPHLLGAGAGEKKPPASTSKSTNPQEQASLQVAEAAVERAKGLFPALKRLVR